MSNLIAIAAIDASSAAERAGPGAEEKLKAAMEATSRHWMATDENDQFLAACEGAVRHMAPDDVERVKASLRLMQALGAASNGIPVDFAALLPDDEDRVEPLPLQKWWREIKDAS